MHHLYNIIMLNNYQIICIYLERQLDGKIVTLRTLFRSWNKYFNIARYILWCFFIHMLLSLARGKYMYFVLCSTHLIWSWSLHKHSDSLIPCHRHGVIKQNDIFMSRNSPTKYVTALDVKTFNRMPIFNVTNTQSKLINYYKPVPSLFQEILWCFRTELQYLCHRLFHYYW